MNSCYRPRDFIETPEGLIFAIVDSLPDEGRVLCCLRYVRLPTEARPRKLATDEANTLLRDHYPHYLHYARRLDVALHGVVHDRISRHHSATARCEALRTHGPKDLIEARLCRLLEYFIAREIDTRELGVTGSLLIDAQTPRSDFDLVAYSRPVFSSLRRLVAVGLASGLFTELDEASWRDAWVRRGCPLVLDEYVWHERRKTNKALFEDTKFDLSLVTQDPQSDLSGARKLGFRRVSGVITDDSAAYDYPARFRLEHSEVSEIIVFTHTYVGQAVAGEAVEAGGFLEEDEGGHRRLVIGSSREAPGEYLRVRASQPNAEGRFSVALGKK